MLRRHFSIGLAGTRGFPRARSLALVVAAVGAALCATSVGAQPVGLDNLAALTPGRTKAANALWIETPLTVQFKTSKRVVVADLKGPAVITMMHFAYPQSEVSAAHERLNRDLLLRIYWDSEATPSVDCPLVDFFCDPAGLRDEVNTALVNVRRGFNAYCPMPFRKSGRVELVYDGPLAPGQELWRHMPCYSYVCYRTLKRVPAHTGYFHASWRQEGLLLGRRDYVALQARGRGKVVGWNVTVRSPGREGYPVDENEKFFIDGEPTASVEFQGLEDSFGFSWGFPESESLFPRTGYFPFLKGAAAYRFFLEDAISFEKSLRVAIGFGANEAPMFRREFSKPGSTLQLSSTVYWYQVEPHAPLPPMPPALERAPAPEQPFWPSKENLPSATELRRRGVKLEMLCGRPGKEVVFAEPGYAATATTGFAWNGWAPPVYHARAGNGETTLELTVPKGTTGTVRIFVIDPDSFEGGRKERLFVAGQDVGTVENFQDGKWLECPLNGRQTAEGKVQVRAVNLRKGSNAVISIVEWVGR